MTRILCLILTLMLALPVAFAGQPQPAPLTMEELNAWTAQLLEQALTDKLTVAQTAAGFEAQGEGYTLYLSHNDLSADSVLLGALLAGNTEHSPVTGLRETYVGQDVQQVLAAYPNDNPHLAGTEDAAVLYISGSLPTPVATGVVRRAGQTILVVEHELYYLTDSGVDRAGVQYTVDNGGIVAIRYYAAAEAQPLADAEAALKALADLQERNDYFAFDTANPDPLQAEDLVMAGLHFAGLTMDTASAVLGQPTHEETVKDTEGQIITAQWDGVEIAFVKGEQGEYAHRMTLTGVHEGPRGIRTGESLAVVLSRLPYDGDEVPVATTMLYGDAQQQVPPYGSLFVQGDSAQAYYALDMGDGVTALMTLIFAAGTLAELTIARL
ncbi:MAG: hypothetical protein ACOX55_10680 [Christensenellales bacterium]